MAGRAVVVGKVADIHPGEMRAVTVDGTAIAVANVGGRFYAFDDTCTHEACSLADGFLEGTVVTCPCHGAEFDVTDGHVVAPPAPAPVSCYPVRVEGDRIVVEV